jgi:hypothetical protein
VHASPAALPLLKLVLSLPLWRTLALVVRVSNNNNAWQ